jgi:protein-tyrosine-phosphatase
MMQSFVIAAALLAVVPDGKATPLRGELKAFVEARTSEVSQITAERKTQLDELSQFVRRQIAAGQAARLTFICTHNSRRSHLAQVWAKTAAAYYGLAGVETYSGGTEATAFNPRATNALLRAGFAITVAESDRSSNPHYHVRYSDAAPAMECFSKVYNEAPNPKRDFCAVMTCGQADESCTLVSGAVLRVAVLYDDPKAFDGTAEETERYDERCRQIAREMLYVFRQVRAETDSRSR